MDRIGYHDNIDRARRLCRVLALAVGVAGLLPFGAASAQDGAGARGPRFLVAQASPRTKPLPLDISRTSALLHRIAVTFNGVPLKDALAAISERARIPLVYGDGVLPTDRRVYLRAEQITVAAALLDVLADLGVDILFNRSGGATIVRRESIIPGVLSGMVMGRVTDAKTSQGVAKADVFLEKTRWQTTTDTGGWYHLGGVDPGTYTLAVRRLGYTRQSKSVTVVAEQVDTINAVLEPVAVRLNELVTTATGRQRRLDVSNDITTINADSVMRTAPIRSVTDLLATRVPGLTVQRTSGAPGDPARLRLRGAGSPLQNNDPIVVVDGVRVYAQQSAERSANLASGSYAAPSPLDYIDPNSIETIEVVKGPSAATLYGQDAANGVIVITTKKGQAGPARWTASVEQGRTTMAGRYPDLLVRWGHLVDGNTPVACPISNLSMVSSANVSFSQTCRPDSMASYQLLSDPALTILDRGHRTAASLGVSGGSAALTYAVTGSYQQETGLVKLPTYEAERYQARLGMRPPEWMQRPQHLTQWGATNRITARLSSQAQVSLTTQLSRTVQQRSSLEGQLGDLVTTFLDRSSGIYYSGQNGVVAISTSDLLTRYFERATATATLLTNGLNLDWRPRPWLTVASDAGVNIIQRADEVLLPPGMAPDNTDGRLAAGRGTSVLSTANLRANVQVPLRLGLQFRFAAGVNYTGTSIGDLAIQTTHLARGTTLIGTQNQQATRSESDDATFGWYVEPSLNHRRFSFTTGLRLGDGGRYGTNVSLPTFPKLGFSYLVSDESFFPFKDLVQSLRLRAAYGRASRQPGPADRLRLYGADTIIFADGQYGNGVFLQTIGNTTLRPERSTEFEGGVDADLLDSRLNLIFTGYRKTTDDALLNVPLPPSVYGGIAVIKNIGVIRNTGFDATVSGQLLRSGALTWSTQFTVSQNRNLVVKLAPGVEPFYVNGSEGTGSRVVAGYPLFSRWTRPILGYADANKDGVLQPAEILVGDTAVYVGQTSPNYTVAFNTTVGLWHGAVSLSVGFAYDDGLSQYNNTMGSLAPFSRGANDPAASLAEQLLWASYGLTAASGSGRTTDYAYIQTVSTLRFNSLGVTYNMSAKVARRLGAQALSISAQGGNLGLWTNYTGLDPNVNAYPNGNGLRDQGTLPQPRTWQLQVHATY